jgi:hypothetical protein
MSTEIRRLLEMFIERSRDIRNGSPNAFYSHVDTFCKQAEALLSPLGVSPRPSTEDHVNPPNLADAAEMLWTVVANVSGSDWTQQSAEWQEAAARWRDYYFAVPVTSRPAAPPPVDPQPEGIGLSLDMLDADRLRLWAARFEEYGPNLTEWGSVEFVAQELRRIAAGIEAAVRDVGALRERCAAYLASGGLFNPELANHDAVRDLILSLRASPAGHPSPEAQKDEA